jgi:hypothetical protein
MVEVDVVRESGPNANTGEKMPSRAKATPGSAKKGDRCGRNACNFVLKVDLQCITDVSQREHG